MNRKLIIHTASFYQWYKDNADYEANLEERIHLALDAGLDGVEISNGPTLLTWTPTKETIRRLRGKTVTLHAEIYHRLGIGLKEWLEGVSRLPFEIVNAVFHPDELDSYELSQLSRLPFPASVENMDKCRPADLCYPLAVKRLAQNGVGLTFDTAHAEENGMNWSHYEPLFTPMETHLSIPDNDYYTEWGWQTGHALTQFRPDDFPVVPSSSPIVTIEGLLPPDVEVLKEEVRFVRRKLDE